MVVLLAFATNKFLQASGSGQPVCHMNNDNNDLFEAAFNQPRSVIFSQKKTKNRNVKRAKINSTKNSAKLENPSSLIGPLLLQIF